MIFAATIVYLFRAFDGLARQPAIATPGTNVPQSPFLRLTPSSSSATCHLKQRNFQMGVAFPQWYPMGYSENDTKWLTELPDMRTQTGACWVEMPLLFYQSSLTSTTVAQGPSTPSVSSFSYGVHFAHGLGLYIFVTPLLQVSGPQPWSGAIQFATYEQEQQWFEGYWQAIKPLLRHETILCKVKLSTESEKNRLFLRRLEKSRTKPTRIVTNLSRNTRAGRGTRRWQQQHRASACIRHWLDPWISHRARARLARLFHLYKISDAQARNIH